MIRLAVPFLLSKPEQIPRELIAENSMFLEGNIFEARSLEDEKHWELVTRSIESLNIQVPGALWSLHFPVENADYLASPAVMKNLFRFMDLAISQNIHTVTIHTNNITPLHSFDPRKLPETRKRYIEFFHKIDKYLTDHNLIVAVENLPVIGNQGDDYDSVFVLPEDFSDFHFQKIKIVWDIGHWAYTWMTMRLPGHRSDRIQSTDVRFDDFLSIKKNIHYFHFSSFHGFAFPHLQSSCREGVTPQEGDVPEELLLDVVSKIHSSKASYTMTLEIQDADYGNRVNLKKTIAWFTEKIF